MEEKEPKTAREQRVAEQVAALRGRVAELGEARGVAVELSDWVTVAEVLEALERLDVEPGPFFAGVFPVAATEVAALRKRLTELAAVRGVELELSEELAVEEVLEALEALDVSPADFFGELWPVAAAAEVAPSDPGDPETAPDPGEVPRLEERGEG